MERPDMEAKVSSAAAVPVEEKSPINRKNAFEEQTRIRVRLFPQLPNLTDGSRGSLALPRSLLFR
jgi:hypothetical protein